MIGHKFKRFVIRPLTQLVLVVFIAACGSEPKQTESDASEVAVSVETAEKTTTPRDYRFSGTVKGARQVEISTKMRGKVTQLSVDEGDRIQKGQVLVRIKDQNIRAQKQQVEAKLREARSSLQNVKTNFQRIKALRETGSATQKKLDDMRTRYKAAQSKVEALESRLSEVSDMLDYTTLKAPFDGFVTGKRISKGDIASPGRSLLKVEDFSRMEVTASVPESQINLFTLKDTVGISITAAGYEQLPGIVEQINPSGRSASRQFVVKVDVPMPSDRSRIKSGMYATLHLRKGGKTTVAVPESAIIERGQLTGLYTVGPDKEAVLRWVNTGRSHNNRIEILSGLAAGEQYIAQFDEGRLQEGTPLNIQ
jgi:RND family efflux transporter MFP subunit